MRRHPLRHLIEVAITESKQSGRQELHLNGHLFCQLDSLPAEIFALSELRILGIAGGYGNERMALSQIPPQISNLRNLETLIIRKTNIKDLPPELFELPNLRELYIADNHIKQLPSTIAKLKSLRRLDISFNHLKAVPLEVGRLSALEYINLEGNQVENIPIEILQQPAPNIVNYLKSILELETARLYEAKLLIVGQGEVGKTSLLKRLVYDRTMDAHEQTTEGIDIHKWMVKSGPTTHFRVNIWDFGGQEIYHATHQFFLTKRSLYLFVWTARNDDSHFDYWLNIIRLLSSSSPVIVVQNKCDERIKMVNDAAIVSSFQNVVSFHRVSALTGEGIAELKAEIISRIVSLEHVGDALPKVWLDIRARLEQLDRNYIDHQEYVGICAEFGVSPTVADYLSRYFHDLGVFLHFQSEPILYSV